MTDITNRNQSIISVSDLNKLAKDILENEFSSVWVQGEVSNFFSASSGHWYFSLKDQNSEIRCAMFAGKNSRVSFEPKDGDNLILNGTQNLQDFKTLIIEFWYLPLILTMLKMEEKLNFFIKKKK